MKYLRCALWLVFFAAFSIACTPSAPPPPAAPAPVDSPAPAPRPDTLPLSPKLIPLVPPVTPSGSRLRLSQAAPPAVVQAPAAAPAVAPAAPVTSPEAASTPDHSAWDALLSKYVSASGKVNYPGFKTDRAALEAYCNTLAAQTPQANWSRAEKMAYWINAYNAFTVLLIVDNFPVSSILKLDGGKTWDVKRISLGGQKYSLNQIENDILRPQFKDARIHFAINCAARSCPPLLNKAYTAANLEQLLDTRTRAFLNNTRFNQISADKASVSKIFEWYAADFGNLRDFINRYAATPLGPQASIQYQEYNWELNE
jgi:hypothetical protein